MQTFTQAFSPCKDWWNPFYNLCTYRDYEKGRNNNLCAYKEYYSGPCAYKDYESNEIKIAYQAKNNIASDLLSRLLPEYDKIRKNNFYYKQLMFSLQEN